MIRNIVVGFLVQIEFFQYGEEAFWIEFQEPGEESLVGEESDYIEDIAVPFEVAQTALRESFSFKEKLNHPQDFIPNIRATMLNP